MYLFLLYCNLYNMVLVLHQIPLFFHSVHRVLYGFRYFRFYLKITKYTYLQCLLQFLGPYIETINRNLPWIHIVKGRAWHPQSQGSVECSHKAFQDSLMKWIAMNGDNRLVGMHIVQCELNKCPS
jgi:hypothetical protein